MSSEINPLEAKRLRAALQETKNAQLADVSESVACDVAHVAGDYNVPDEIYLLLSVEGKEHAHIKINRAMLKRWKRDFCHFERVQKTEAASGKLQASSRNGRYLI